jgi:DNA-binding IclR family transcriptional regulator
MVSLDKTRYSTRAVERAIDLLFCLARAEQAAGVTDLAAQLELNKATVFRLLQTLSAKGLVAPTGDGTYALTPRVLSLGVRFLPHQLKETARPHLEQLRDISGETATLSVRIDDERVFLDVVPSRSEVRMVPEIGRAVPLIRGASGKVLLAFADVERRRRLVQSAFSGQPKRALEVYETELERVRRDGYARSAQERTPGASSLAAPVRDRARGVVAVVALSAPESRLNDAAMKRLLPLLIKTANIISRELGCPAALLKTPKP